MKLYLKTFPGLGKDTDDIQAQETHRTLRGVTRRVLSRLQLELTCLVCTSPWIKSPVIVSHPPITAKSLSYRKFKICNKEIPKNRTRVRD